MHLRQQQKPINEDKATHLVAGQLEVFGMVGKPLPTSCEDGWSAPMLMALSNHANLGSLGIYTHPSTEAVAATLAEHDPGRRRR